MSTWCEEAAKDATKNAVRNVHGTNDLRRIQQIIENFSTHQCYNKQYLLRIFTLKTPHSIMNHFVIDEKKNVMEIPVPIRDFEGLVELDQKRFYGLYKLLLDYIKQKFKQISFITVDKFLDLLIDIKKNDYFNFDDESRLIVFQRIAQQNKRLINIDHIRNYMGVESYIIELISYLLFDDYQPIDDENIIRMHTIAADKNAWKNIFEESPDDIGISEEVILPVFKIAEMFELSFDDADVISFQELNEDDRKDFKYFIKRFYNAVVENEKKYVITEKDLFVFYFVMGLKKLIDKNRATVTEDYLLTAEDHIEWLRDNLNYNNKTIDAYYNYLL